MSEDHHMYRHSPKTRLPTLVICVCATLEMCDRLRTFAMVVRIRTWVNVTRLRTWVIYGRFLTRIFCVHRRTWMKYVRLRIWLICVRPSQKTNTHQWSQKHTSNKSEDEYTLLSPKTSIHQPSQKTNTHQTSQKHQSNKSEDEHTSVLLTSLMCIHLLTC
jgi:hypothetical protein